MSEFIPLTVNPRDNSPPRSERSYLEAAQSLVRVNKKTSNPPRHVDTGRVCVFNIGNIQVSEAWTELRLCLSEGDLANVKHVARVTHKSGKSRLDITVLRDFVDPFQRLMRAIGRKRTGYTTVEDRPPDRNDALDSGTTKLKRLHPPGLSEEGTPRWRRITAWRFATWTPWVDRPVPVEKQNARRRPKGTNIVTINVNGFHKKKIQVVDLLETEKIAICAMQETLVRNRHYPVKVQGFATYQSPAKEGFRGLALLVDNRYPSYEVPHDEGDHLIHVKVSGLGKCTKPCHVLALYLPSGGNYRGRRTALFKQLAKYTQKILKSDPGSPVVCLGDLNMTPDELVKKLLRTNVPLHLAETRGSNLSRFPVRGSDKALDHILWNEASAALLRRPRVLRQYAISDHRPVVAEIRESNWEYIPQRRRPWIDRKRIRSEQEAIAHDNRWAPLARLDANDMLGGLDLMAAKFSETCDRVARAHNCKIDPVGSTLRMPHKVLVALKAWKRALESDAPPLKTEALRRRYKSLAKAWRHSTQQKKIDRLADDLAQRDYKNVWAKLRSMVSTTQRGEALQPVRREDGTLATTRGDILAEQTRYFKDLASDPTGESKRDNWSSEKLNLGETLEPKLELNEPLRWEEMLMAIRGMNVNTAPGPDDVHINFLKAMVREESMQKVLKDSKHSRRQDQVQVDVAEQDLPTEPLTPMGRALFRVLSTVWESESIPRDWQEVHLITLFKSGDPESLANYRGISLISVTLKVILSVVADRLSKVMNAGVITKEQAGFRKNEECMGQFLTLAEIVRRRHLEGKATYVAFIDFKKAYDKVLHGAMLWVLHKYGVTGKMYNFIKALYESSVVRVRTGGELGEPFPLERGTRQGCSLSPLLFILLINSCFQADGDWSGEGVHVQPTLDLIPGGKYADDLALLAETDVELEKALIRLSAWAKEIGQEIGYHKCGLMCCSEDKAVRVRFKSREFTDGEGIFPHVDEYKYLGINVDWTLVDSRGEWKDGTVGCEFRYSKSQAQKGMKALHQLRPLLTDRKCPLPLKQDLIRNLLMPSMTYGGEWLGGHQLLAAPIQRVVDTALRWSYGLNNAANQSDAFTLREDLRIPSIYEVMADARLRLAWKILPPFADATYEPNTALWLGNMMKHPYAPASRKSTWVTQTQRWARTVKTGVTEYGHNDPSYRYSLEKHPQPLRPWAALARMYEMHNRSNKYRSRWLTHIHNDLIGSNDQGETLVVPLATSEAHKIGVTLRRVDLTSERSLQNECLLSKDGGFYERRLIRDILAERGYARCKTITWAWYHEFGIGATRDYHRTLLRHPNLTIGAYALSQMRTRTFPQVKAQYFKIKHLHNFEPEWQADRCPLCKEEVEDRWDWAHLLVSCKHPPVLEARSKSLKTAIRNIRTSIQSVRIDWGDVHKKGIQDNQWDWVVAIYLIGGVVKERYDLSHHIGFGQTELHPFPGDKYGCVSVAEFLQEVASLWREVLKVPRRQDENVE